MDQFFGKVDEFFSLKRWAADGFQIVDSVQKTFPRRTNRRKKCQSHSNSRKEKSSRAYLKRTNCFLANSILRRRCDTILSQKL